MIQFRARELTINKPASPVAGHSLSPTTVYPTHNSHRPGEADSIPVVSAAIAGSTHSGAAQTTSENVRNLSSPKSATNLQIVSPFHDCLGQFGKFAKLEFRRPNDGFVNGYVKIRWANRAFQREGSPQHVSDPIDTSLWGNFPTNINVVTGSTTGALVSGISVSSPVTSDFSTTDTLDFRDYSPVKFDWSPTVSSATSPDLLPQDVGGALTQSAKPHLLPPQFGFQGKMETNTDRKFWEFCKLHSCYPPTFCRECRWYHGLH